MGETLTSGGFLRTYADYLELDPEVFVDEYKARFAPPEEPLPQLIPRRRINLPQLRALGTVGALIAVALVVVLAWRADGNGKPTERAATGERAAPRNAHQAPVRVARRARPEAGPAKLILTAAHGRCWLHVNLGSRRAGTSTRAPWSRTIAPFRRKAPLGSARCAEKPRGEPERRAGRLAGRHSQRRRNEGGCADGRRQLAISRWRAAQAARGRRQLAS